ncbi:Poly(A) RNA polymerase cid13 [Neolecta irregularis DAH-3]|uniref:polynucleotide adenylyltransferase n=1 Tax=Neolecta irregularis (strain DAH-3) TaxID=1198029 RepID=A0A1U7LSC1_NEOID|nr:Poly(A) RNA polymerase cid13 [Neolecta irregularis DAH-3]|eukprot:OLL25544.1 Poly(A) RNA polymerase cid13 [Neolecta irregularis DAH-3]
MVSKSRRDNLSCPPSPQQKCLNPLGRQGSPRNSRKGSQQSIRVLSSRDTTERRGASPTVDLSRKPHKSMASPRSAKSEPLHTNALPEYEHCPFETSLNGAKRRIAYSVGTSPLPVVDLDTIKSELTPAEEEILTTRAAYLYTKLVPTPESDSRRNQFLSKLETILRSNWPDWDIRVHPFGSSVNNLCFNDSDVDVCITSPRRELEHTCRLAKVLAKHGMERVVCVSQAKIPIVKIWDPELMVACDMNINHDSALENTRMIRTFVEIDPRVRQLAMIVKHWTRQRKLNDAAGGGTLTSYTWTCMIINFLQTRNPPILPVLHNCPPGTAGKNSFWDDPQSYAGFGGRNVETLGALLLAFFRKFAYDFDYEQDVISVKHGCHLSKSSKGWQFNHNNRLCVEEPFNTGRNLANTADDITVKGIQIEMRRGFHSLVTKIEVNDLCDEFSFPPEDLVRPAIRLQQSRSNGRLYNRPHLQQHRFNNNQFRYTNGYRNNQNQGFRQSFNSNQRLSQNRNRHSMSIPPTNDVMAFSPLAVEGVNLIDPYTQFIYYYPIPLCYPEDQVRRQNLEAEPFYDQLPRFAHLEESRPPRQPSLYSQFQTSESEFDPSELENQDPLTLQELDLEPLVRTPSNEFEEYIGYYGPLHYDSLECYKRSASVNADEIPENPLSSSVPPSEDLFHDDGYHGSQEGKTSLSVSPSLSPLTPPSEPYGLPEALINDKTWSHYALGSSDTSEDDSLPSQTKSWPCTPKSQVPIAANEVASPVETVSPAPISSPPVAPVRSRASRQLSFHTGTFETTEIEKADYALFFTTKFAEAREEV